MSPRKGLLGLLGVLAVAGVVAAEPPINPLVEGRELDPIAREFHEPDRSPGGYMPGPMFPERTNPGAWGAMIAGVWQVILDRFTFPLGTAPMQGEDKSAIG